MNEPVLQSPKKKNSLYKGVMVFIVYLYTN